MDVVRNVILIGIPAAEHGFTQAESNPAVTGKHQFRKPPNSGINVGKSAF